MVLKLSTTIFSIRSTFSNKCWTSIAYFSKWLKFWNHTLHSPENWIDPPSRSCWFPLHQQAEQETAIVLLYQPRQSCIEIIHSSCWDIVQDVRYAFPAAPSSKQFWIKSRFQTSNSHWWPIAQAVSGVVPFTATASDSSLIHVLLIAHSYHKTPNICKLHVRRLSGQSS